MNDYQIRLRGMARRMMATVSELSMYQAHSIKLSADKAALEEVVTAAASRLEVRLTDSECGQCDSMSLSIVHPNRVWSLSLLNHWCLSTWCCCGVVLLLQVMYGMVPHSYMLWYCYCKSYSH